MIRTVGVSTEQGRESFMSPLTQERKRKTISVKTQQKFLAQERLVFRYIYLQNNQISTLTYLSPRLVEHVIERLFKKFKVSTRVAVLWRGIQMGWEVDDQYVGEEMRFLFE